MKAQTFDAAAHVAHMERVVEIAIDEAWRPTVVANMAMIARAAELVMGADLADDLEQAPVFTP